MKKIFKLKDFNTYHTPSKESQQVMVDIANHIINKLINESITVYGTMTDNGFMGSHPYLTGPLSKDTHKAKLMFIEELLKEECKHENVSTHNYVNGQCDDCGAELVSTWEIKK